MEPLFKIAKNCVLFCKSQKSNRGQLLIESLVVLAISAIILPALLTAVVSSRGGKSQQIQRAAAVALLKGEEEVVRSVREQDWANFAVNGIYHPVANSNAWSFASGSENINGFIRSITISDIRRDANGVVVTSGGTVDPSTKKVDINISWTQPYSSSVSSVMYVTRFLRNSLNTQTTLSDFNAGTTVNTAVSNNNGGEVSLASGGGGGDWCNPSLSISTADLSRQGVPTSISAFSGNIVTGTGGNASGPTFVKLNVTGNNPPIATIIGQYNNSKANNVFTEGNYGYIATTNNGEEIQILDLTSYSNPPTNTTFSKVGYFNAPGNGQGDSVFIKDTVGYMTDENKFYTFNMTSHTGSRPHLNTSTSWSLAAKGNKVVVIGNYAYVAVNSTTTQLQVIDVSNPTSPQIVASAAVGNGQAGIDVSVNSSGTRAYLATGNPGGGTPDFYIINTTTKSGSLPKIGAGYSTGSMIPKGIAIATGNRAIIVGAGGALQYQVVNITNELLPTSCAGLVITNGANAVSTVIQNDGYAYSYIVTGDSNAELKMILGGAGGSFSTQGTFTSNFFDAGASVAFNRIIPNYDQPNQSSITFQVAVAAAVNNSCTNAAYSFLGPDGTSDTFYTTSSPLPLITNGSFTNPGRCIKYKAYFTSSDTSSSPVLNDVSINYSP